MNIFTALFRHVGLALMLKHNGAGMPTEVPAASMLISLYCLLNLINNNHGDINIGDLVGLCFIAQCYLFCLRDKLIGLIIFISIIINALMLGLSLLAGVSESGVLILTIVEYIMIFAAIINVIKSETSSV